VPSLSFHNSSNHSDISLYILEVYLEVSGSGHVQASGTKAQPNPTQIKAGS